LHPHRLAHKLTQVFQLIHRYFSPLLPIHFPFFIVSGEELQDLGSLGRKDVLIEFQFPEGSQIAD
jgi:hypothetical protein